MTPPSQTFIAAIDPGTNCGWCVRRDATGTMLSGVWDLKPQRHEGAGMRYVRARKYVVELLSQTPRLVVYEEVRSHKGTAAAHVYGGITAVIQEACETYGIPYTAIPVGVIKQFATGRGNAKKPVMVEFAQAKWPEAGLTSDDECDARWIAECTAIMYPPDTPHVFPKRYDPYVSKPSKS